MRNGISACALLLSLSALSGPALANLRAPLMIHRAPSSALYPADPGLTVSGEELRVTCDGRDCQVQALYRIESRAAGDFGFEFILPVEQQVLVRLGGETVPATVAKPEPVTQRERDGFSYGFDAPLFKASFNGRLRQGPNEIRISYAQPLSSMEVGHSYFSDGRFIDHLQYEIWPLKEWALGPAFALEIEVRMARPPPGWLTRAFGHEREMDCQQESGTLRQAKRSPLPGEAVQREGFLVHRARLGRNLPDRLLCFFGDDDLLAD